MRVKGKTARRSESARKDRRKGAYERLVEQLKTKKFSEGKDPKKEQSRIEKEIEHLKSLGV